MNILKCYDERMEYRVKEVKFNDSKFIPNHKVPSIKTSRKNNPKTH